MSGALDAVFDGLEPGEHPIVTSPAARRARSEWWKRAGFASAAAAAMAGCNESNSYRFHAGKATVSAADESRGANGSIPLSDHDASEAVPEPFEVVSLSDLGHVTPEAPQYAWEGLAPIREVMIFAAHGGVGKSTVMLMLAVSVVLGRPFFGQPTRQTNVAYYSAEDGKEVIRHRVHFICGAMGVSAADLEGQLFILDATAHDPALFTEVHLGARREGITTPVFDALREFVKDNQVGLVIIDNTSDAFDASEIERAKVRGFMRSLANLARECDAAVILLAHVDKGTSRGERGGSEGYSGSTAWNNSARSRAFMSRDKDGTLLIEHQKHNLGPLLDPIRVVWPKGGLPQVDAPLSPVVQGIADRNDEKAILRLIVEYAGRGELISTAETGRGCITSKLGSERSFPSKLKAAEVFQVLRESNRAGRLSREMVRTPDRKTREVWAVTETGLSFAGVAPNAPNAPNPAPKGNEENGAEARQTRRTGVGGCGG